MVSCIFTDQFIQKTRNLQKLFYWTNSMENQTCKPPEVEQLFLHRHLKTVVQ